jgi:very-short-patch-repair endonuclease
MDQTIWTTRELYTAGWTKRAVAAAVEKKELFRVGRGFYTTEDDPDTVLKALVVAHPGIVFTGRTAAYVYRSLPLRWPVEAEHPSKRHTDRLITIRRRARQKTTVVNGVEVITAAKTAASLVAEDADAAVRVLEWGYTGIKGTARFREELAELSREERKRLRSVAAGAVLGTASDLEKKAVRLIRDALKPELESGRITLETNGMVRGYCFDIVIREARVLIEIDSWTYHGEGRARKSTFVRDRHKGNQAARWGWTLLRFADPSIDKEPEYVAVEAADTVRFILEHDRLRREDEALDTDRQMWLWHARL